MFWTGVAVGTGVGFVLSLVVIFGLAAGGRWLQLPGSDRRRARREDRRS